MQEQKRKARTFLQNPDEGNDNRSCTVCGCRIGITA